MDNRIDDLMDAAQSAWPDEAEVGTAGSLGPAVW